MKQILITLSIILSGLFAVSCNALLDMSPTDKVSDKTIWLTTPSAEYAVNYMYSYVKDVYSAQCSAGLTEALTDQLKYGSYTYNALCFIPSEIAYGGSNLTASYVNTYLGGWSTLYWNLRTVNEGLRSLHL